MRLLESATHHAAWVGGQFWGCCRDRKEPIIQKSVVSDLL